MTYEYSGTFSDNQEKKTDPPVVSKQLLDAERDKVKKHEKEIADLKLRIESMSKTPKARTQLVQQADKTSPFAHIHAGLEQLSQPGMIHDTGDSIAWAYDKKNINPNLQNDLMEIDRLLALTNLSKDEVEAVAAEITLATAYNDHFGLSFIVRFLQAKIAIKAEGRKDALKILGGAAPKISVPTTLQKVRTMFRGRGDQKEEVGSEQDWQAD